MNIRPLTAADFDAVVALDRQLTGTSRRDWFARRLRAAVRAPQRHLQLAVEEGGLLVGFVLVRQAGGEFGRPDAAMVIEAISVAPDVRGHGLGTALIEGVLARMKTRGVSELCTQASWRNHGMLRFLDAAGFNLAPRHVLARSCTPMRVDEDEDFEVEPHFVRTLAPGDLQAVLAIDARITGQDRSEYLRRKVDEALAESAIIVSLVAEDDHHPVAFLMARVDGGEFGRMNATAVLDTLGVDPRFARRGFGEALLEQLLKNLQALDVDLVQTEVDRTSFGLLGWFYKVGFQPSSDLVFRRTAG